MSYYNEEAMEDFTGIMTSMDEDVSDEDAEEPLEPMESTEDFGYEDEDPDKDH